MKEKLDELKARLLEINDLDSAASVLSWDQNTYMPPGGAAARGRQMGTLARISHEKATDPNLGRLLDELMADVNSLDPDSDDACLIQVAHRDYQRAVMVPSDFIGRFYAHMAASFQSWTEARPESNFNKVLPFLEKTLEFSRDYANFFPGYEHIADPLIANADYGMKATRVRAIFQALRARLVPLVQAITSCPPIDSSFLQNHFPEKDQIHFGEMVIKAMGYDFNRGRQDKAPHPFTTKFANDDVRITTRVNENDLGDALFSTIHEAGHAFYELGVNPAFDGLPIGQGTSAGIHESQSRLWENIIGRSKPFWSHFYPLLVDLFPNQLHGISLDQFYKAINKVERSLIRVDADEVTYNLHVMLRFDLELDLLEGKLKVKDLPEAWRERFKQDIGIVPDSDRLGVLQDVHWYAGTIGGSFQGYTLGNILSAQFYAEALKAHPSIEDKIAAGNFQTL
ncbi:MAG TPA: carboxypeptidase M32, partial [Anaerolineaceae bacterium]